MVGFQIVFRMLLLESFDMTLMDTASTALFSLICCHPVSALPVFLLVCNSGGDVFFFGFFALPSFCADFDDIAPMSLLPAPPPPPPPPATSKVHSALWPCRQGSTGGDFNSLGSYVQYPPRGGRHHCCCYTQQ